MPKSYSKSKKKKKERKAKILSPRKMDTGEGIAKAKRIQNTKN